MNPQREQAANLLELLEHIREKPNMHMTDDLPPVVNLLTGLNYGLGINIGYDFKQKDGIYIAVLQERGWEIKSSLRPFGEMRERGMDDDAITEEMLTIAIEVVKRRYLSEDTD